ncbi:MAG: hypothetical protein ACLQLG_00710 [Thermoguttaceae bacterium]
MRPYVFALVLAWIVWAVIALCFIYLVRSDAPYRPAADETDRRWQFSLRTLLLLPLWLWLLLMACFPKLMTGDFCNVRIDKLSVHTDGHVRFSYTKRTSGGTGMNVRFVPGGGGIYSSGSSFPRVGPSQGTDEYGFYLHRDGIPMTERAVRDCLLVEQGRTYRVVPEKPLFFYDFKGKDGTRHYGYVEVEPGKRLGF